MYELIVSVSGIQEKLSCVILVLSWGKVRMCSRVQSFEALPGAENLPPKWLTHVAVGRRPQSLTGQAAPVAA